VAETGEVWDVHQLACLIGYGAAAVHPYLALTAAAGLEGARGFDGLSACDLQHNYLKALENGFLKVSSKMGISTATGYRGAQIFEAIGISHEVIDRYFTGTPTRLGGIGLTEVGADIYRRYRPLPQGWRTARVQSDRGQGDSAIREQQRPDRFSGVSGIG
jgi:hypothetical protein